MHQLYIFRCNSKYNRYGFTFDKTGAKLPELQCKGWSFLIELPLEKDGIDIMSVKANLILDSLDDKGYYIHEP